MTITWLTYAVIEVNYAWAIVRIDAACGLYGLGEDCHAGDALDRRSAVPQSRTPSCSAQHVDVTAEASLKYHRWNPAEASESPSLGLTLNEDVARCYAKPGGEFFA